MTKQETFVSNGWKIQAKTADEAWLQLFNCIQSQAESGFSAGSRDGEIVGEVLNTIAVIEDPTRNIVTNKERNLPMRYAIGELMWYLSGSNWLQDITKFSKVWERMSDNGKTVNSAYGHRIFRNFGFNQFEYVVKTLKNDPLSRQAVIHIKGPVDYISYPTKDVPCTVALQYFLRAGKLYATTYMRSNDLWMGFPYDVFSFTCLQILIAFNLHVDIGTYTHIAGSLHLYKRDYDKWKEKQRTELPLG